MTEAPGQRNGGGDAGRRGTGGGTSPGDRCVPALWPSAFPVDRDPKFLWLGDAHGEAFEAVYAAVVGRRALVLLTGEAGTGKTMLAEAMAARLADDGMMVGRLPYPSRDVDDFWTAVAGAFGLVSDGRSLEAALRRFARHVEQAARSSIRMLLVVDEAQALTSAVLMEVSRACDLARDAGAPGVLTVLLVGHDELDATLATPVHAVLAAQVAVRCRLAALPERAVAAYIQHRLRCVGAPPDVFTPDALTAIGSLSRGLPRLINTVCARATANGRVVDAALVQRCGSELAWVPDGARQPARPAAAPDLVGRRRQRRRRGVVTAALVATGLLALAASNPEHRAATSPPEGAAPAAPVTPLAAPVPAVPRTGPSQRVDEEAAPAGDTGGDQPDPSRIIDWLLRTHRAKHDAHAPREWLRRDP
jgi:general secretion pathway protein A